MGIFLSVSFRGDAKRRTRNLEIPRCAIAHLRSGPADHPGMTELFRRCARDDRKRYVSFFNILNTPLAITIQRLSAVTSVVTKIRLRVERTTRGLEIRISPILPLSTKWVSSWTVASVGRPDTYRAVMPQLRSADVNNR